MQQSATISELAKALAAAQGKMPAIKLNATNPFLHNKYADLGAVISAVRPILAEQGLSIIQAPISEGNQIGIETTLLHQSGEWQSNCILLPLEETKGLSLGQAAGVLLSYLRRYSVKGFLSLADEDSDGAVGPVEEKPPVKSAEPPKPAKPEGQKLQLLPDETMREDIWKRLMKNAEGSEPGAAVQLEIQTSFTLKDKETLESKTVPGVRSVADLRGKRLQITYERIRHRFPDEEPPPVVGDANEQA